MHTTLAAIMFVTLLGMSALPTTAAEIHVSPSGSDGQPGTAARPIQTLPAAQAAARSRITAGLTEPLDIVLHGGTWFLADTLRFGPADAGTTDHPVTWRALDGTTPVVSGGARVGPWRENANEHTVGHYALWIRQDRPGAYLNFAGGAKGVVGICGEPGSLAIGTPHTLALTYDGMQFQLFLDGVPVGVRAVGKPRPAGNGPFAIDTRPDGFGSIFPGTIHEVRLYREALGADILRRHAADPDDREPAATLVDTWRPTTGEAGLQPAYRHLLRHQSILGEKNRRTRTATRADYE